jgi:hypothetical protein
VDGDSIPIALMYMERGGLGQISVFRLYTKLKEEKEESARAAKRAKMLAETVYCESGSVGEEDAAELAVSVARASMGGDDGATAAGLAVSVARGGDDGATAAGLAVSAARGGRDEAKKARKPPREYEYVNIRMLYNALRCILVGPNGARPEDTGHEISMLVSLIGMSGTDFTRGLPFVSGKTLFGLICVLWGCLGKAYDRVSGQIVPDLFLDIVVSTIYTFKFPKHSGPLEKNLNSVLSHLLRASKLSKGTKDRLPTRETLHCTVRNVNWLILYWRIPDECPDPVQPAYGFTRVKPGGAVCFEA